MRMKRFTLWTLALMLSVVAFAQKGMKAYPFERVQQTLAVQGTNRLALPFAQRVSKRAGEELVTPPATVTAVTYYTNGGYFYANGNSGWEDITTDMPSVQVAIDGTDMYIQGLAYWFKDSWVKGTISGETVTFAAGQFVGEDSYGAEYLVGSEDGKTLADIVFTFDNVNGVLTAVTDYILESGAADDISAYCFWYQPVFTLEEPAAPEVVVLPDGVELVEYAMSYTDYNGNAAYGMAAVGVDGDDVYFQGFSSYIPEALIKGVKDGNTITFPANQYLGTYSGYDCFFMEEAVFTFDPETESYAAEGAVYSLLGSRYIDVYASNPVLKKVVEKAAMPANPAITALKNGDYGYVLYFNVPNVDVNGEGLVASKLSYIIYTDVEQEVSPLTFTPATHSHLTESMTEIPFGFSENYDFYADQIYLNDLYSKTWNKIGIQSIYTGGGEQNVTEIQWFDIKDYHQASSTVWVAADQNYENAEDITEIDITEGVTGTLEQGEGVNAPKYYTTGAALRMYAGNTLTINSEKEIVKIAFAFDTNNGAKIPAFEASTGEVEIAESGETGTWTGEATEIVLSVPSVSGMQTRIQTIEVFFAGGESLADELVVLPVGVESEEWTIEGTYTTSQGSENVQNVTEFAKDGNDIYVKGLAYYFPDAWLKGTLNEETGIVTFVSGQFVGEDDYGKEYIIGSDDGETISDIEFVYDAEAQTLTQSTSYILENGDTRDEFSFYGYWTNVQFYAGEPIVLNPVVAPDGLVTETYLFKGMSLEYDEDSEEPSFEDYSAQVQVGFDGDDLYIQGLATDCPDLWVKATKNEEGKYVIPANQFMGTYDVGGLGWFIYDYFFTAVDSEGNLVDVVLNYDAETNTLSTSQTLALNGSKNSLYYYLMFTDVTITKMVEVAATPADPKVLNINLDSSYPSVQFDIPTTDVEGNELLASKLFYQIWIKKGDVEQVLTLSASDYDALEEDMTEIPYTFGDDWDIYAGGSRIYLNMGAEELSTWTSIGVQSIYRAGGEENKSNIVWGNLPDGINDINADLNSGKAVIFNLAGQRLAQPQKGLNIINGRKVVIK